MVEDDPIRYSVSARDDGIIKEQYKYSFRERGGGRGSLSTLWPEEEVAEAQVENKIVEYLYSRRYVESEPLTLRSCMENGVTALGCKRRSWLSV